MKPIYPLFSYLYALSSQTHTAAKVPFCPKSRKLKIWTFGMVCPHSTSHTPSTLILLIKKSFTFTRVVLVLY